MAGHRAFILFRWPFSVEERELSMAELRTYASNLTWIPAPQLYHRTRLSRAAFPNQLDHIPISSSSHLLSASVLSFVVEGRRR
jgi:hypothetical protein